MGIIRRAVFLLPLLVTLGTFSACKKKTIPETRIPLDAGVKIPKYPLDYLKASTLRTAILTQLSNNPNDIRFSAYGITDANSSQPVLKTSRQSSCIVLAIRNRKTTQSLLAHMVVTGKPDKLPCGYWRRSAKNVHGFVPEEFGGYCFTKSFPSEGYVRIFKSEYFPSDPADDLEITVVIGMFTPNKEVIKITAHISTHFPGVAIRVIRAIKDNFSPISHIDPTLDSRTGKVTVSARLTAFGVERHCPWKVKVIESVSKTRK